MEYSSLLHNEFLFVCACVRVCVRKITSSFQLVNYVLCKVVEVQISTAIRFLKMCDYVTITLFSHTENFDQIWIEHRFKKSLPDALPLFPTCAYGSKDKQKAKLRLFCWTTEQKSLILPCRFFFFILLSLESLRICCRIPLLLLLFLHIWIRTQF